jgi:hypothetical protein
MSRVQVAMFYLVLYRDEYKTAPAGIWQVIVHSYESREVQAAMGQLNYGALTIRGTATETCTVQCCSGDPRRLTMLETAETELGPGQLHQAKFLLRPALTGRHAWLLNLVDVKAPTPSRLVHAWLVTATVPLPVVSRNYEAKLFTMSEKRMRIKYTNPYTTAKKFLLRTDNPVLLHFEADKLDIMAGESSHGRRRHPATPSYCLYDTSWMETRGCEGCRRRPRSGESMNMALLFQPQAAGTIAQVRVPRASMGVYSVHVPIQLIGRGCRAQIYVFINDENDLVLETICINGLWV